MEDAVSLREPSPTPISAASANIVNAAIIAGRKSAFAELQLGYERAAIVIGGSRELSAPTPIEANGRKAATPTCRFEALRSGAASRSKTGPNPDRAATLHSATPLNVVHHLYL
ncbi:MAG: hypothetical protein GAK45_01698 [Pseudomonas citronellolis]|nr:MAG: hypothetical protein GAK45_01698 [Pseudomonas citronellolis]